MVMPGRKYSAGTGYRYGFNGKEEDDEVKGDGNFQDYGFRIYDVRVVRFISVDPLKKIYPELTPYQFASNRPIDGVDMDGLE
jgi:RHS repeat-associated protein